MVIRTRRDKEKELTILLYRSETESNHLRPLDLLEPLQQSGITTRVLRKNPTTDAAAGWAIIVDLVQNHSHSAAIVALILLWLKEKFGRRVEIERGNLKVTAPTAKELEKALSALVEHDRLTLSINTSKSRKQLPKKQTKKQVSPAKNRSRKK